MISVTIDIKKMYENINRVKKRIDKSTLICAVLKGDAYGCGMERIALNLQRSDKVDFIAVGTIKEAIYLRNKGINLPILALCELEKSDYENIVIYNIIPSVTRMQTIYDLNNMKSDKVISIHIRLDVSNGSSGMHGKKLGELLREAKSLAKVRIDGIYSHITSFYFDDIRKYKKHLECFSKCIDSISDDMRKNICVHVASTPAIFKDENSHFDMVRIGSGLYGLHNDPKCKLENIVTIKGEISNIKKVSNYVFDGYECEKYSDGKKVLANIMGGYEDAFYLAFSQNPYALVNGEKVPVVGKSSMDSLLLDITDVQDVKIGDEVIFLGKQGDSEITISDIMNFSTIEYSNNQLIFKFGKRTPIEYINENKYDKDALLRQVQNGSPVIKRVLQKYSNYSVKEYLECFGKIESKVTEKSRAELVGAMTELLLPVIGKESTEKALQCIGDSFLTANHHGIDTMAQCVQGNYLYKKLLDNKGISTDVIPVLACTNVPLDNSSYAKGLLVYDSLDKNYPFRIPLIPNKDRRAIVALYSGLKEEQVKNAIYEIKNEKYSNKLSKDTLSVVEDFLNHLLSSKAFFKLSSYVEQATYINLYLSKKAFGYGFAYIALEQVAEKLIQIDLENKDSILYAIFSNKQLQSDVIDALDGVDGCWNQKVIKNSFGTKCGSVLFWGVKDKDRRYALFIEGENLVSHDGKICIKLNRHEISKALEDKRIYPTLFMSFLVISFQRKFLCYGGYFQPLYLYQIKKALASALVLNGYEDIAKSVLDFECDTYLSGPIIFYKNGFPLSIFELINDKVITRDKCLDMSIKKAHVKGLSHMYMDIVPYEKRTKNWKNTLIDN